MKLKLTFLFVILTLFGCSTVEYNRANFQINKHGINGNIYTKIEL